MTLAICLKDGMSAIGVDFCSCISRQTHHHRSNTCPCLLKGSVSAAERPRTLRRLRHVYSPAANCNNEMGSGAEPSCNSNISTDHQSHHHHQQQQQTQNHQSSGATENERDEKSLGVMSPFDEQEEWAKISEIMATFGTGLVRESVFVSELEREFQNRLCMNADGTSPYSTTLVGQWLSKLNLADYESLFVNYGFDDLEFINGVLDESDLKDMGIGSEQERATILKAVALLDNRVEKRPAGQSRSVDEWLKSIHLDNYAELFRRHLYTDMDRVRRVWEVELAAVLEIQKPAHRKRILASVSGGSTVAAPVNATSTLGRHTKVSSSGVIVNGRNGLGNGPNLDDLNKDLNALKSNIQQLKDEIREKLPESVQTNGLPSPMSTAAPSLTTTTTTTTTTATTTVNSTNPTGTLKARKNRPAPPPPQRPPPAQPVQQNGSHNHHPQQTLPQQQQQPAEQLEIRGPSELLFGVPSTLKTQWRHQPKDLVTGCVTYVANYLGSTVVKELRGTESTKKSIQKLKKINRDPRGTPDITLAISYRGVRFLNTLTDEPICEHEIRNIHCACQDADDLTHFAYITKDHASRTHFCHVFCVPTMDQATEIILTLGQAFEVAYQIALKDKLGNQTVRSQSANQLSSLASSTSKSSTTATVKTVSSPTASKHNNDYRNNETNNHHNTNTNPRSKTRSKSITNPFVTVISSNSNSGLSLPQQSSNRNPSPSKTLSNFNSHSNPNGNFSSFESNSKSTNGTNPATVKFLSTHGRSHSVNEIKINGNQLKLAPAPVDDINIGGVRDMKAGSRAPIALTDEL